MSRQEGLTDELDRKVTLCTFLCRSIHCNIWSVGFYDLHGIWHEVSQCAGKEQAFHRCHVLHGGGLTFLDFMRVWGKEG